MSALSQDAREVLVMASDDYLDLWNVHSMINGTPGESEVARGKTLSVIEELIGDGFLRAGDLLASSESVTVGSENTTVPLAEFQAWTDQNAASVRQRIENTWANLSRPLNVGDVVWFEISQRGENLALKLTDEPPRVS